MGSEEAILTISVAANLLKLHPRTLMLYEKTGLISPFRTATQRRLFSIKDIERLQFIKFLCQVEGVNLHGAKVVLRALEEAEKEGIKLRKILFPEFRPEKLV